MSNYDGTKETSAAAAEKARTLVQGALNRVTAAIADLNEAREVFDTEERRHQHPSPGQHTSVMWQGMTEVLEKVAECLGGPGEPGRSVHWNGEDFEVQYVERKYPRPCHARQSLILFANEPIRS